MNKKTILILAPLFIIVGIATFFELNSVSKTVPLSDYKNIAYIIDGQTIKLSDGASTVSEAPDSASKIVTRYFGNELWKDVNKDGYEDVIFLLTQERGGSGTFFYVAVALQNKNGFTGSHALFLGDRIAPQNTISGEGDTILVNYAERHTGESMVTAPSVGKTLRLRFDNDHLQFGEIVTDFEGEANPDQMTLDMKSWNWISADYNDGREIIPKQKKFTLTFDTTTTFSATTDCNTLMGTYSASNGEIYFSNIGATKMFCEDSEEGVFLTLLENTSGYDFTSKGELIFHLKFDSGSVVFR